MKHSGIFYIFTIITAYTLLSLAAIFLLVRGAGAIVGLFLGSDSLVASTLSQLGSARVSVPFWILLFGAAAACAIRGLLVKRFNWNVAVAMLLSVAILALAFIGTFLQTRVNGVFVHVTVGIIKRLLQSGMI